MRLLALAIVAALLLTPAAGATHVEPGADCAPAAAYVTRIDARIAAQRAVYNTTNADLTAAKAERDDLAEELIDDDGDVAQLAESLALLRGQGSKLQVVVQDALAEAEDGAATPETVQQEFFDSFMTNYDVDESDARDASDEGEVEDALADFVDDAETAATSMRQVLEERANAATSKRALDALGAELRALQAESTAIRQLCGLGGTAPAVPTTEQALGSFEGPSDADLVAALFDVATAARLVRDVQSAYLEEVIAPLLPLADDDELEDVDTNDLENALEDVDDALDDHAEPIDLAIDRTLAVLDAFDFDLPTDPAIVEDREDDSTTSDERVDTLADDATLAATMLRLSSTLARSSVNAARASAGRQVTFVAPGDAAWPGDVLVVAAGADPAAPLVTLASNGTTRLLVGTYDIYAQSGNARYLLRAGAPIASTTSTVELAAAIEADLDDAPEGARWTVVPRGSILLPTTFPAETNATVLLAPPGAYEVVVRLPGRIESFVSNVTLNVDEVADVTFPLPCRALADAVVLDVDGDGIDLDGATKTSMLSARNVTIRWTTRDTDDAFLAVDADTLREAGWAITDDGEAVRGTTMLRDGLRLRAPGGALKLAVDAAGLLRILDVNADGRVDASDSTWGALRLWTDADADGAVGAGELGNMDDVRSIGVAFNASRADAVGNLVRNGTSTTSGGATRLAVDVFFAEAGRCGNPEAPVVVTPTPTPTPTPSPTPSTTPTPTAITTPTPSPSPTPHQDPRPTPTPTPTPTPGEQEPQGPIPAPGLAVVVALVGALAVLVGRRRA